MKTGNRLRLFFILAVAIFILTACPGKNDKLYPVSEEEYLIGWVLHNINDSTPTTLTYSLDELATYTYSYNYPANASQYYSNVMYWVAPFQDGAGAAYVRPGIPQNRVYYVKGDEVGDEYRHDWSFANSIEINYLTSDNEDEQFGLDITSSEHYLSEDPFRAIKPVPGANEHIYFGTAPYTPASVIVNGSFIRLNDYLIRGYDGKAYLRRETVVDVWTSGAGSSEMVEIRLPVPTYKIYLDGDLLEEGKITDRYDEWDYTKLNYSLEQEGSYLVELEIPSGYPVFDLIKISASFNYTHYTGDIEMPILKHIEFPPRFEAGEEIAVSLEFDNEEYIGDVSMWYKPDSSPFRREMDNNSIIIDDSAAESIDFGFSVSSGDALVSYEISPISLRALDVTCVHNLSNPIIGGGLGTLVGGVCVDEAGKGVGGARLELYSDDEYLGAAITNITGKYLFETEEYVNDVIVTFDGTGVYNPIDESGWNAICNNGYDYELTSNRRVHPFRIRKPTSYILPDGSIDLGIRNLNTGEENYDVVYTYASDKPNLVSVNGNQAYDVIQSYFDYNMFIDISIPVLSHCSNIKQPMRVMVGDLFMGEDIAYIYPDLVPAEVLDPNQAWANMGVGEMMATYDFSRVTDLVYDIQEELFGVAPLDNDALLLGLMPEWCGGAGQPIGFGIGCLIQPNNEPHWGVVFHEIGHVATGHFLLEWGDGIGGSYPTNRDIFANFADCCGLLYPEGIATLAALYSENRLINDAGLYDLSPNVYDGIYNQFSNDVSNYLNDLNEYESQGSPFADINPNILDGIFAYLADNQELNPYRWELYPRFFRAYLDPLPWTVTAMGPLTELQGHTYFVAALSAASGSDLRGLFVEWNFPIDAAYYDMIYPEVRDKVLNLEVKLKTSGSRKYQLQFKDGNGNLVNLPLAYAVSPTEVKLGDNDDDLILNELDIISKNDYFVVSDYDLAPGYRNTYALRYVSADKITDIEPVIKIAVLGVGIIERSMMKIPSPDGMIAHLRLGGQRYNVYAVGDINSANFDIRVDLDGDGELGVNAMEITTKSGAVIGVADRISNSNELPVKISVLNPPLTVATQRDSISEEVYSELLEPIILKYKVTSFSGDILRLVQTYDHISCNDSDGGIDYYNNGEANAEGNIVADECSYGVLSERFCYNNEIVPEEYSCDNYGVCTTKFECAGGCMEGSCGQFYLGNYSVDCTDVSINGYVSHGLQPSWDWGDGAYDTQWFPGEHTYIRNGIHQVRAYASAGSSLAAESLNMSADVSVAVNCDCDGVADMAVYNNPDGMWYIFQSDHDFTTQQFGWSEAYPVVADYDGDNFEDLAVYHNATGTWYFLFSGGAIPSYLGSNNTSTFTTISDSMASYNFGWSAAEPVQADYDGDGKTDMAVYHQATGTWYILQSTFGIRTQQFGWSAADPVPADYDGDGKTDIAVYHQASGTWYLLQSKDGMRTQQFGWSAADPVPADYDGDGKDDIAVYHPATGTWYILQSSNRQIRTQQFGWSAARPVPNDYDGDGRADLAVYYAAESRWYYIFSGGSIPSHFGWANNTMLNRISDSMASYQFGWNGPIPVPANYDGDCILG